MSEGRYVCQACGEEFPAYAIRPNPRDDYPCPACGRLRLERIRTWLDNLRAFLIGYNRA
jgi:DNA-directed RNA polymerase subunit RPC12/RpoP